MTNPTHAPYGDPIHHPFWMAAHENKLVIQHCESCGHYQFYGRPFCLKCQSDDVQWAPVKGTGTVYSATQVHVAWFADVEIPYTVAIVELDEGVRMMSNLVNGDVKIGERVRVVWKPRDDGPPLPLFESIQEELS